MPSDEQDVFGETDPAMLADFDDNFFLDYLSTAVAQAKHALAAGKLDELPEARFLLYLCVELAEQVDGVRELEAQKVFRLFRASSGIKSYITMLKVIDPFITRMAERVRIRRDERHRTAALILPVDDDDLPF